MHTKNSGRNPTKRKDTEHTDETDSKDIGGDAHESSYPDDDYWRKESGEDDAASEPDAVEKPDQGYRWE